MNNIILLQICKSENKTATFYVKICQIAVSYRSNAPSQSMNDNNGFLK